MGARLEHTFWSYPPWEVRELRYLYPNSSYHWGQLRGEGREGNSPGLRPAGQVDNENWSSQKALGQIGARTAVVKSGLAAMKWWGSGAWVQTNSLSYSHSTSQGRDCGPRWPEDRKIETSCLIPGTLPHQARLEAPQEQWNKFQPSPQWNTMELGERKQWIYVCWYCKISQIHCWVF